jgi:hypothetical protein
MTDRYVTEPWALARFSCKGIYAKAQSRKGAKRKTDTNIIENEIAKIVVDAACCIHISA